MVDNLTQYLEREAILFPASDEELYMQLISYVVVRTTQMGRPIFEAGGSSVDHAHDALMLALLAITQNYGDFSKLKVAKNTESFSNTFFMPKANTGLDEDKDEPSSSIIVTTKRNAPLMSNFGKRKPVKRVSRKMF
jgi:hypothetical protein